MVSRRSLLGGFGGLLAGAPLASAVPAAPPAPLAVPRGIVPGGTSMTPVSGALSQLAVTGPAEVRLRTAAGWQPWRAASGCPAGPDGGSGRPARLLVPAAGALEYEVRSPGGGPVDVLEVSISDSPAGASTDLPLAAELSGFRPRYLNRAGWGADESYRYNPDGTLDTPPAFYPVQTLTVHHSGEDAPVADPIAHIRAIYYNQAVTMDWGDIGYQLVIDEAGTVYEGTYSDADRVPVFGPDPRHPQMVNGSHVGGFNAGNVGVCLLGNYMYGPPSRAALRSLTVVLALLARATGLDPLGTTNYVNPISGATATIATLAGHQDWHNANPAAGATLCPGDYLYAELPRLRQAVAVLSARR